MPTGDPDWQPLAVTRQPAAARRPVMDALRGGGAHQREERGDERPFLVRHITELGLAGVSAHRSSLPTPQQAGDVLVPAGRS